MALRIGERGAALLIDVQVSPRASKSILLGEHDGALKIALAAPPVDGAANRELLTFVGELLGLSKRQVTLVRGETAKRKTLALEGTSKAALEALLTRAGQ